MEGGRHLVLEAKCPHCGEMIELAGAGQLEAELGINQNQLQYLREHRERLGFPEAWLSLGNRHLYLGTELRAYVEGKKEAEVQKRFHELVDLSAEQREELVKLLNSVEDQPKKRRRVAQG